MLRPGLPGEATDTFTPAATVTACTGYGYKSRDRRLMLCIKLAVLPATRNAWAVPKASAAKEFTKNFYALLCPF